MSFVKKKYGRVLKSPYSHKLLPVIYTWDYEAKQDPEEFSFVDIDDEFVNVLNKLIQDSEKNRPILDKCGEKKFIELRGDYLFHIPIDFCVILESGYKPPRQLVDTIYQIYES